MNRRAEQAFQLGRSSAKFNAIHGQRAQALQPHVALHTYVPFQEVPRRRCPMRSPNTAFGQFHRMRLLVYHAGVLRSDYHGRSAAAIAG